MKTLLNDVRDTLAEGALREDGIVLVAAPTDACKPFAEAAEYDDIHTAILHEHLRHCAAA